MHVQAAREVKFLQKKKHHRFMIEEKKRFLQQERHQTHDSHRWLLRNPLCTVQRCHLIIDRF